MAINSTVSKSPWDNNAFNIDCYSIDKLDQYALEFMSINKGHYSIRIDPLADKMILHDNGFYYCDTLLEPYCTRERLIAFCDNQRIAVEKKCDLNTLLQICDGAFAHGRFHRDFNISKTSANQRYNSWLSELCSCGNVYQLKFNHSICGFIAVNSNSLVLHALSKEVRGLGLSKFFWTIVCQDLFNSGVTEIISSISATNTAVLNLYARLGFKFRKPTDIYHKVVL